MVPGNPLGAFWIYPDHFGNETILITLGMKTYSDFENIDFLELITKALIFQDKITQSMSGNTGRSSLEGAIQKSHKLEGVSQKWSILEDFENF